MGKNILVVFGGWVRGREISARNGGQVMMGLKHSGGLVGERF